MRLSRETRYALIALTELAAHGSGEPVEARRLAEATDLPAAYLSKILQMLSRAGIVDASRGRGYTLVRPADSVTLREILVAIEGSDMFVEGCIFWREECSDANPCPLHWRWRDLRPGIEQVVGGVTLAQIREHDLAES
jgi:Rrf2 family iron-sulfur cluster assembly transcriptional regulator